MSASEVDLGLETVKSLGGKFLQAAVGFAGIVIFARVLGKNDFGGYYLLFSVLILVNRPIQGFALAVRKRWSESDSVKEELFGAVIMVTAGMCLVTGIGAWVFSESLITYTGLEGAPVLFAILFACVGFFIPVQRILEAEGWPSKQTWNDTLRSLLTLPLQLGFVAVGFGALGMGYGLGAATVACIPIAYYFIRTVPTVPSPETLRSLVKYAKYSIPGTIVGKSYDRMDVLLLGILAGTTSIANYEVALKLTLPATFLIGAIGSALMPKVSSLHSQGDEFSKDVVHSLGYVSLMAVPLFFGSLVVARPVVVTAFGGKYADAAPYLIGLALFQILSSQHNIYAQTLAGMDMPDVNFKIGVVTLIVNVIIGVTLIYVIGPIGVVVATVITEGLRLVVKGGVVVRKIDVTPLPRPLLMQVVAGIGMLAAVTVVERVVMIGSWIDLLLVVGSGGVVYGMLLLVISPGIHTTVRSVYRDAVA